MSTFSTTFRTLAVGFGVVLIFASLRYAQEPAQKVDPKIAAALKEVSPARIQANIEKLVSFGTRSTFSAQDPTSIAARHGIGAAREWIKSQFARYSKDCGGCLEVKTDAFTQAPAERIPQPTEIVNVYAVMKGRDPEAAKRIVLVTGHYDSRVTDVLDGKSARRVPMTTAAGQR
jgi:phosphatidylglycerophosphate synthase